MKILFKINATTFYQRKENKKLLIENFDHSDKESTMKTFRSKRHPLVVNHYSNAPFSWSSFTDTFFSTILNLTDKIFELELNNNKKIAKRSPSQIFIKSHHDVNDDIKDKLFLIMSSIYLR